ncbi:MULTISPECIES: hypothetical protein [unclassified Paenibacillus]|uniref:hypothetical protein n=1 Tax=unclassified Paenibacillus TaxID=185978 RepID=UPI00277B52F6|nr:MULTISPECIES: hypothetical protein [unclassified Paenibacillus]
MIFIEQTIRLAQAIAERVIGRAGKVAKDHFDQITCAEEKGNFGDVVTEEIMKQSG